MIKYSQVTLAISDECFGGLEGFAPLSGQLPEEAFHDAIEDGKSMQQSGTTYCVYIDLMNGDGQIDEKCISLAQAGRIIGAPCETLVQLGRQRLAKIDDEAASWQNPVLDQNL